MLAGKSSAPPEERSARAGRSSPAHRSGGRSSPASTAAVGNGLGGGDPAWRQGRRRPGAMGRRSPELTARRPEPSGLEQGGGETHGRGARGPRAAGACPGPGGPRRWEAAAGHVALPDWSRASAMGCPARTDNVRHGARGGSRVREGGDPGFSGRGYI